MKTSALIAAAVLSTAAFGAFAQTGRPSTTEAPAAPIAVAQGDAQVGSYARYLMLNGTTRDEAIAQAASVDHPASHPLLHRYARAHTAPVKGETTTVQQ